MSTNDDWDFIKGLMGGMLDAGYLASADQQAARTSDIALELFGSYLAFCHSIHLHDTMGTLAIHHAISERVKKLAEQGNHNELVCVVAQLCHLTFTMVLTRHDGDWDKLRAAAERGELFFNKADASPDQVAAFELGLQ